MADYRSILDRAIDGLQDNTEEARRAIYEKARGALMRQLSSLQPALSPAEISKQRLQLEEAVRETEGRFSGVGVLEDAVADALSDITLDDADAIEVESTPTTPLPDEAPEVEAETKEPAIDAPTVEPVEAPAVEAVDATTEIEPEPVVQKPDLEEPVSAAVPEAPKPDVATIDDTPKAADAPADIIEPTVPSVEEAVPDAPKVETKPVLPEVSTEPINLTPSKADAADVNQPAVEPAEPSPLDELRETMASDGVEIPTVSDDLSVEGTDNFSSFEAPDPNEFQPADTIAAAETKKSGGKGLLWILLLLILIGAGTFGWAQRDVVGPVLSQASEQMSAFFSSFSGSHKNNTQTAQPSTPSTTAIDDSAKSEDRVPTAGGTDDGIEPGTRVALPDSTPSTDPIVIKPETQPEAPAAAPDEQTRVEDPATVPPATPTEPDAPAPTETAEADQPIFTPPAASEETPADPAAEQTTTPASNLFSSSAILYEERAGSNQPDVAAGNVVWEVVPTGSEAIGSTGLPSVKGNARIESRDLGVRFELMRNLDSNLPASHLIELEFTPGPLFNGDEINNIAGVIAKKEEQQSGARLKGAIVKVSERVFWVAMSAQAADLAANSDAVRQQNWFDIPLVFKSGKRAILTLEKGAAGKKAIDEAYNSWGATN